MANMAKFDRKHCFSKIKCSTVVIQGLFGTDFSKIPVFSVFSERFIDPDPRLSAVFSRSWVKMDRKHGILLKMSQND